MTSISLLCSICECFVSIPHAALGSYQAKLRFVGWSWIIEQIRLTVIYAVFGILVLLWPNEVAKCVDGRSESSVKVHKLIACVSWNVREVQFSCPFSGIGPTAITVSWQALADKRISWLLIIVHEDKHIHNQTVVTKEMWPANLSI